MKISNIFICGSGHSGTTLMLAILDSHPMVSSIPVETGLFLKDVSDDDVLVAMQSWRSRFNLPENDIIVEKTPSHTKSMERILRLCPSSRIIVMVRDGRDSSCSEAKRLQSFERAVRAWKSANNMALKYASDNRVKFIKYEDLISNMEAVCMDLCAFLGLPYSESMTRHHEKERKWWDSQVRPADPASPLVNNNHKINRNWQINQPVFDGRGRWVKEMSLEQKGLFKTIAGDLLIRLGYVDDLNW